MTLKNEPVFMARNKLSELLDLMASWRRWQRWRRGLEWASYGLIGGLCLSLCMGALGIFLGWLLQTEFVLVAVGITMLEIVICLICGYAWPISIQQAARTFDRSLNLKERISTAVEYSFPDPHSPASDALVRLQLMDTLAHIRNANIRYALPIRIKRLNMLISAILVLFLVLLNWQGASFFNRTATQRLVESVIARQIEKLDALQTDVQNNTEINPEAQIELVQILERATHQLEQAESAEQAISVVNETQQALSHHNEPQLQALAQTLQSVGSSWSQQDINPLNSIGRQFAASEFASAAEELAALNPADFSPEQHQAVAEQLSEAAQALQSSSPELAESLKQAAEALRAGKIQAVEQALAQTAQSMQQTAGQIAQSKAAAQIASQLANSQQQILQATQSGGKPSGQSGATASSQTTQSAASGGAGRGDSEDSETRGPEASENPISQNNAPGEAGESPYQPLYSPDRMGGSSGELVTLPVSSETGELSLGQGYIAPGSQNRTTVPYVQVYAYYNRIYRQAIENGEIPASLRYLVRDYFTSLEP